MLRVLLGHAARQGESALDALMTIEDVAAALRLSPRTLRARRYREQIGLRGVRIGRALRFREADVAAVIRRDGEAESLEVWWRAPV